MYSTYNFVMTMTAFQDSISQFLIIRLVLISVEWHYFYYYDLPNNQTCAIFSVQAVKAREFSRTFENIQTKLMGWTEAFLTLCKVEFGTHLLFANFHWN